MAKESAQRRAVKTEGAPSAQKLIRAASSLMRERDTLEISFTEIADRAGVQQGLIGYYFGNKEGLLYAVLEASIGIALKQLNGLLSADLDPAEKMRRHLYGVAQAYFNAPYFNRLLQMMTRDAAPDRVNMIAEKMIRPMVEAQAQILDDGVKAGVFRPVDKMLFYFATVGAADGLHSSRFILEAVFGRSIDVELNKQSATQIVDLFINGLLKTDGS